MTGNEWDGGELPAEAIAIANVAYREARDEGCNCVEPNIAMSPTAELPYWRATVEHDPMCALVVRLRRNGAPL